MTIQAGLMLLFFELSDSHVLDFLRVQVFGNRSNFSESAGSFGLPLAANERYRCTIH